MAGNNSNLGAAKRAKNDEFYTQYSDIEAEMNAYVEFNPDVFRGKTILLPCDDPEWSNFTKYFAANFERFGLKKLISTSYAKSVGSKQLTLFEQQSPMFDANKHDTHGKLFILERDTKWKYVNDGGKAFEGIIAGVLLAIILAFSVVMVVKNVQLPSFPIDNMPAIENNAGVDGNGGKQVIEDLGNGTILIGGIMK